MGKKVFLAVFGIVFLLGLQGCVSKKDFDHTLVEAARAGFQPLAPQPKVRLSLSKVLVKQQG